MTKKRAEIGDNSANEDFVLETMKRFAKEQDIQSASKEREKKILREGKEGGILKTAIRKAYKDLQMTLEQKQAKDEVEAARKEYVKICKEIGLFVPEEEAA